MKNNNYKPNEYAELINVSVRTLQRWYKEGTLKAYKIEIKPTEEQITKIHQTIGVSRFIYNFYIAHNKEVYEKEKKFVSSMDFF